MKFKFLKLCLFFSTLNFSCNKVPDLAEMKFDMGFEWCKDTFKILVPAVDGFTENQSSHRAACAKETNVEPLRVTIGGFLSIMLIGVSLIGLGDAASNSYYTHERISRALMFTTFLGLGAIGFKGALATRNLIAEDNRRRVREHTKSYLGLPKLRVWKDEPITS